MIFQGEENVSRGAFHCWQYTPSQHQQQPLPTGHETQSGLDRPHYMRLCDGVGSHYNNPYYTLQLTNLSNNINASTLF